MKRLQLKGDILEKFIRMLGIAGILYHIYVLCFRRTYLIEVHMFIHLIFFLLLTFLIFPLRKRTGRLLAFNLVPVLLLLASTAFFAMNFSRLLGTTAEIFFDPLSYAELAAGILLLVLMFEAARRVVGVPYLIVIALFIFAMSVGSYMPKGFTFPSYTITVIVHKLLWDALDGIWGIALRMSSTFIILFFVFGKMMQHSGAADLLMSLARVVTGSARGGPAKVAVVGSGLVGSITGGPATNIAMTGSFTIPMMKQSGYKPYYAAAIECAASSGSAIMPPVMGGVAFIIAELAQVPYVKIMLASFLPACLYFLGILIQVHYQAIKQDIRAPEEKRPKVSELMKQRGHLLIPIAVLVVLLFMGYTAIRAGSWGILSVLIVSWLRKETRMGPKKIADAFYEAAVAGTVIAVTLALAGVVVIALFVTGLAGMLTHFVATVSGGSLLIAMICAAVTSIIIGMSGPSIVSYLIVVMVIAPLIVAQGLPLLTAHIFSLYFANIAYITPPVALGAFVAGGIAGASFWRTGFTGIRLAVAGFVVPFIFIYRPAILLFGSPLEIILSLSIAIIVIVCLASMLESYLIRPLNIYEKLFLFAAAMALIPPKLQVNIGGIILVLLVVLWQAKDKISSRLRGV